jgi:hypothetical protein
MAYGGSGTFPSVEFPTFRKVKMEHLSGEIGLFSLAFFG